MAHTKSIQESQSWARSVDDIFGPPTLRRVPSMPAQVICYHNHMTIALEPTEDGWVFRQSLRGATGPHRDINAGRLRDAFLSVKTPEEALRFLNASGRFRFLPDKGDAIDSVLTWNEFQLWQRLIRIILVDNFLHLGEFESPIRDSFIWGPKENGKYELLPEEIRQLVLNVQKPTFYWLQGRATGLQIASDEEIGDPQHRLSMIAEVMVDTSVDAMLASIYIDTQSGIEYELCSLSDCSNVYEMKSNHQRAYCSQACAHKASVRRKRTEVREAKRRALEAKGKAKTKKVSE
jgi:hypothetical protein